MKEYSRFTQCVIALKGCLEESYNLRDRLDSIRYTFEEESDKEIVSKMIDSVTNVQKQIWLGIGELFDYEEDAIDATIFDDITQPGVVFKKVK